MSIAATPAGHEFSDRLNPFLVKELRQGLRGRAYLALYLLLILVLTVHALFARDIGTDGAQRDSDMLFRAVAGFTLAVLLPMNLLGAIHEERRGRKIELVMLSRVNARGVVLGKWLVATLQSMTLAAMVTPFVVVRYFAGGFNFLDDICFLLATLFTGLLFGAATLCASSFIRDGMPVLGFLTRAGIIGAVVGFGATWVGVLNDMLAYSRGDIHTALVVTAITFVLCVPPLLEIAAAQLAPEAVNHDGVIRLMSLAGAALAAGAIFLWAPPGGRNTPALIIAYVFILVTGAFTLFGERVPGHEHRTPLDRFGKIGRAFGGVFLKPGWASGLAFLMLAPLPVLAIGSVVFESNRDILKVLMALWGAIVWPMVVAGPLFSKAGMRFGAWLVLQVLAIVIALMINIASHARAEWGPVGCLLPTTGLLINLSGDAAFTMTAYGFGATYAGAFLALAADAAKRNARERGRPQPRERSET